MPHSQNSAIRATRWRFLAPKQDSTIEGVILVYLCESSLSGQSGLCGGGAFFEGVELEYRSIWGIDVCWGYSGLVGIFTA